MWYRHLLLICFCSIYSFPGYSQLVQFAAPLEGTGLDSQYGISISLSADGQRIAIVEPTEPYHNGIIKVFERMGEEWIQLGSGIQVDPPYFSLYTFVLSGNGKRVAYGARNDGDGFAKVFEFSGEEWVQLGGAISDDFPGHGCGSSIDLSFDGKILAVGCPYKNIGWSMTGRVGVYLEEGGEWEQLGTDVTGEEGFDDFLGNSVSLSGDGMRLAAAVPHGYGVDEEVRAYRFFGETWFPYGTIENGNRIILTSDGLRVFAKGIFPGIYPYERTDVRWEPRGQINWPGLDSVYVDQEFAVTGDGKRLIMGLPEHSEWVDNGGLALVYFEWESNWIIGDTILVGENQGDRVGRQVAVSADGRVIAVGVPGYDGVEQNSGIIYFFEDNNTYEVEEPEPEEPSGSIRVFPNPTDGIIFLDGEGIVGSEVSVFNMQGVEVFREKVSTPELDIDKLAKGMYFLKIATETETFSEKIWKL